MSLTKKPAVVPCFIGALRERPADPFLNDLDLCQGMIVFGIPDYGIQFKCRARGKLIDLEFGAFFSLMKTVTDSVHGEKIHAIQAFSSSPEFVFAFTGRSQHLVKGSQREKLIREYGRHVKIGIGYVSPQENKALLSPIDYPAVPKGRRIRLKPQEDDRKLAQIKPYQRGIEL